MSVSKLLELRKKMDKIINLITERGFDVEVESPTEIKVNGLSWNEMKDIAKSLIQSGLCTPEEVFTYQPVSGWLNGYDFAVGVELQPMSAHNKTYAEDAITKLPHIALDEDGLPSICRNTLYNGTNHYCNNEAGNCAECWNEEMED